ncbi:MAG: SH3 domain-containing protein, partial [Bacillota bacterium]|nr:SH3 domain-containing protein [Bacillota bacterium]
MKNKWTSLIVSLFVGTSVFVVSAPKTKAATVTITRSQVEQRAQSMMDLVWNYNSSKNSNISSQYSAYVTQPKQFQGIGSAQMTGIPYNWGGIDGIDTYSY